MELRLGVKSDPIEYRYTFPWLFRLMAEEGVTSLQLGSFFEVYHLPDDYFRRLRREAETFGVTIDSLFTAHRELGGFFREDPAWAAVARRNFRRFIEVGALLGAKSVGSNPGAVPRDRMGLKADGLRCYLANLKELMHEAHDLGVEWLTIEPMSCLAEPPTLPGEIAAMGEELATYHDANAGSTARVGYCTDIAHGYLNAQGERVHDHLALFDATLPWLYELHLKNTDDRYHSTFGFGPEELDRGIVDVADCVARLRANAAVLPGDTVNCYLEIGGPKLGRDYTDGELDTQLRESLRHLRTVLEPAPAATPQPAPTRPVVPLISQPDVTIAPSMMCVDPLNIETALRRVEALGVDMLHMDVMDGHFVPNAPMGLSVIDALRERTHLPLDVHLMVENNDFFLSLMEGWSLHQVSVHVEACPHLDRTLARIREGGALAGISLNPSTPLSVLEFILDRIDFVLLMTVNPGFAGQVMTPASLRKIDRCRRLLDERGYGHVGIQVDGNVSFANIPGMVAAGADSLVAGTSSLFSKDGSWRENMDRTRAAIAEGLARRQTPEAA